ncbi:MAG: YwaF family protein [Lachnospiraceae bacterium]|nr:YwaF family protein [Lachnospiraceae bacterium]
MISETLTTYYEPIAPGSAVQISITVCLIAAGIFLGALFARSKTQTRIILLVCGVVLMITEVFKQIFLYRLFGSYPWSDFPFQLCSIPMYFCVLDWFLNRRWIEQFIMVYGLIGAAASFCVPQASFSGYILLTIHSLFWHTMLLILGVFLMLRQTKESMKLQNYIPAGLAYLFLAIAAVAFNAVFYSVSNGSMNMFFLGPGWPDMFILNDIYQNSGWIPATLGMIGVSEAAGFCVYLLIFFLYRRKEPGKNNEK